MEMSMSKSIRFCLAAFIVVIFLASCAFAQGGLATFTGVVKDPQGAVVSGAKVHAVNMDTNISHDTETNASGIYSLSNLPPGRYRITVNAPGFAEVQRPDIEAHVADNLAIPFSLPIASTSESTTVVGGAPLVNTTTSSLGGLVNADKIRELPLNGRNYTDLTLLQPGIVHNTNQNSTASATGTWYSSNGAPLRSNNITLDGAVVTNLNAGSGASLSGTTLGLEGIQEFKVITNAYSAEYGLSMGSQTVIVSKSGTNQWHGSVFEFLRNSALDAAPYFHVPLATNNFERLPPFKRNNFGGSIGGPIRKEKTFFFATYEGLRERLGVSTVTSVIGAGCHGNAGQTITNVACPQLGATASVVIAPVIKGFLDLYPIPNLSSNRFTFPYSQPNRDDYIQGRVDHTFSVNDSIFGRYTFEDNTQIPNTPYPQFNNERLSRTQYLTLSENHVFTSSMLNSLRISYSRTASARSSSQDLIGAAYSLTAGFPLPEIQIGGVDLLSEPQSKIVPSVQYQDVYGLSDDLSYSFGKHTFKFGTQINNFRLYFNNANRIGGRLNFASVANFLRGITTSVSVNSSSILDRSYRFNTLGFYAQDDWKVKPRLTLNLGLRYEPTTQLEEVHGAGSALINPATDAAYTLGIPFKNPSLKNFSPRVGFAWDIWGDGKTALRGGVAMLYDVANLGTALVNMSPSQPPFTSTSTLNNVTLTTLPITVPASAIGKDGNITFQYNFKQPTLISQNLTIEHQLPFSMSLSLAYSGSRGIHLTNLSEGNPKVPTTLANGDLFWSSTAPRLNPNWGSVSVWGSTADSNYHSMQISLLKRMTHGLQFQTSFTWSKSIDNAASLGQGDSTVVSVFNANPFNSRYDRGPSNTNVPRNLVMNVLYMFPKTRWTGFMGGLANGWGVGGITILRDGLPFHPREVTQRSRSGASPGGANLDRPSWNPAFTGDVILGGPVQYFNPNAFILQPVGTLGNVGRNSLIGPGLATFDFSLRKNTRIGFLGEAGNLEFRTDAFNLFNRPNFASPDNRVFTAATNTVTEAPLATAGVINSTVTTSRQIQVSLRLSF
jgi:outer membrane receptor protein involved in Fe transport